MSNRSDGKTNFSSYKVRSFESSIPYSNNFHLFEIIKAYLSSNSNKKVIIKPSLSKEDTFDYSKNTFIPSIKIYGHILDETINDNDIFEELYLFFENIFIELDMKELHFLYKNFNEDPSQREISYKIFKNKKRTQI